MPSDFTLRATGGRINTAVFLRTYYHMSRYLQNLVLFGILSLLGAISVTIFVIGTFFFDVSSFMAWELFLYSLNKLFVALELKFFLLQLPPYIISLPIAWFVYRRVERHILSGGNWIVATASLLFYLLLLLAISSFGYGAYLSEQIQFGTLLEYTYGDTLFFIFISEVLLSFAVGFRLILQIRKSIQR